MFPGNFPVEKQRGYLTFFVCHHFSIHLLFCVNLHKLIEKECQQQQQILEYKKH